ncbi:MAG: hypothetical protein JF597_50160 [Streptomyces sp.]|uniref:DUF6233 domain-containing protein n=1 Tax=Streptomyces sp. TaxID=1931 RepID=UPI0025ECB5E3|nr:DUF6233 domain-containing protein [Streptomyces sp.]MBW8801424.1 hypothetical protein [Streptomyces sp.]
MQIYLRLQADAVRAALAAAGRPTPNRQWQQPQRSALEVPTLPYMVEQQLSERHPLGADVHRADCTMAQRGTRPITAEGARQALVKDPQSFRPCEFCRPDRGLGIDVA